jgi:autotransporter adhesin
VQRQLVNLAAGTTDTDAVNLSQLSPLAGALGGGSSYAAGVFTAPTYIIQSSNYNDVGSAFAAVDGAIDDINERIVAVGGIQGEQGESAYEVAVSNGFAGTESDWLDSLQGEQGPSGATGPEGPAGGGPRSVTYDSDERDVLTLAGANGTRIANVATGVAATDAANVGQMQAGDADTLQAANDYTDNTATETLTSANAYTDQRFAELTGLSDSFDTFRDGVDRRFQQQDRRIDKQGSMSSAMLNMAINAAGSQSPRGRVAAGIGFQGGERALSVGYAKRIGQRASFSLGGAFSGSEKSAGMGFGIDL